MFWCCEAALSVQSPYSRTEYRVTIHRERPCFKLSLRVLWDSWHLWPAVHKADTHRDPLWKKKVEIPMLYNNVYIKKSICHFVYFFKYIKIYYISTLSQKNHQLQIFAVTYVLGSGRLNKNKQKMLYCSHRA